MLRWTLGVFPIVVVVVVVLALACGGGSSPSTPSGTVRLCFYDAAETSYNRAHNPDIQRHRVPVTGLTVNDVALGASQHCAVVEETAPVFWHGEGYLSGGGRAEEVFRYRDANEYYMFVVPEDLKEMIPYITFHSGNLRGWGPGAEIRYLALEQGDVERLDARLRTIWDQLQPIDLDPYVGSATRTSIVEFDAEAGSEDGVVVLENGTSWHFQGAGSYEITGGTLFYDARSPARQFDERLLHLVGRSIGQHVNRPETDTGFHEDGTYWFRPEEVRALRVATNLAGMHRPVWPGWMG